ncbi:hybrid sensor histidine kinase/response regulator [Pelagibaculum spongiae]|uniref:histidine kinase n=1 Tax=Pelagibaculum spongiae TaxID=2080658 RepID=A0A2V1GSL5_9GAMM|nr:PAS domain-containing hybrid sensor histidine kinase/response regulator [Pelagibaculum spongiae]PVZ65415.1 hybrid sensor histidine kinase/response regulator [Pelagibaculum spongiae]
MPGWLIAIILLGYIVLLFTIAWLGDRREIVASSKTAAWVYGLSLAVYCTAWSFFGAVGQASEDLWSFLPIYLGPLILFWVFWKLPKRLVETGKAMHSGSIADFLANRYGKDSALGLIVTGVCLLIILPYIALQLKGMVVGYGLLTNGFGPPVATSAQAPLALVISLMLALFTILFGARHADVTEHHRGIMMAIAFESLVKLLAFVLVGCWVIWGMQDGPMALLEEAQYSASVRPLLEKESSIGDLLIHTMVAMLAFLCLPRQFQVMVVENRNRHHLSLARWVFSGYIVIVALLAAPLAIAGKLMLPASIPADGYVISLPLFDGQPFLALIAFIGGASAATGMVIVATMALSVMINHELLLPMMLKKRRLAGVSHQLLNLRRASMVVILLLAWLLFCFLDDQQSLGQLGMIAFVAAAQLSPALVGGLFWRQGNRAGVYCGLIPGLLIWLVALVLPAMGLANTDWLEGSAQLVGLESSLSVSMLLSLGVNALGYSIGSLVFPASLQERRQALKFCDPSLADIGNGEAQEIEVSSLEQLMKRFLGRDRSEKVMAELIELPATSRLERAERLLAGVVGRVSARLLLDSILVGRRLRHDEMELLLDEASEQVRFSRQVLHGALENINQGISVVDSDLRLVAWNRRYLELFNYPSELVQVGTHVQDLIRFNADRGLCGPGENQEHVTKRIGYMLQGRMHRSERIRPDGRVIEIQGTPLPDGGFVMTFTDISVFRQVERALKSTNETLEQRVDTRTRELEKVNEMLLRARNEAEKANQSKGRFLAAISHDLVQPLNASRLFLDSLKMQLGPSSPQVLDQLDQSLNAGEDMLRDLLEISRLESGKIEPRIEAIAADEFLGGLVSEFQLLAKEAEMELHWVKSSLVFSSDPRLLRRILQNFLTNSLRYAKHKKLLLGCKRRGDQLEILVCDNGPGIPEGRRDEIFAEFCRLGAGGEGLGLGLAIAKGFSQILEHPLHLVSRPNRYTAFSIQVPLTQHKVIPKFKPVTHYAGQDVPLRILCIDNELSILSGLDQLLTGWGHRVRLAADQQQMQQQLADGWQPQLVLADYHLNDGDTGLNLFNQIRQQWPQIPGIVISADHSELVRKEILNSGLKYLPKPVRPAALRALLRNYAASSDG